MSRSTATKRASPPRVSREISISTGTSDPSARRAITSMSRSSTRGSPVAASRVMPARCASRWPAGITRSSGAPSISAADAPKSLAAPSFQRRMTPPSSAATTASRSAPSTDAKRCSWASRSRASACVRSIEARRRWPQRVSSGSSAPTVTAGSGAP
jgi:hypothetical protein